MYVVFTVSQDGDWVASEGLCTWCILCRFAKRLFSTHKNTSTVAVATLHAPSLGGELLALGGDIRYRGSRGCAPSGSRGRAPEPLIREFWGPQKLKAFLFHNFFSEARAEIKRFDRF